MSTSISCSCQASVDKEIVNSFSIDILQSTEQFSEMQWNKHIPENNKLMQYEQMRLIESSQAGKMEFRYAFVIKEGVNVGVAYFQIVRFRGVDLLNYFPAGPARGWKKYFYRFARAISKPLILSIDVKLLVSGNVFMTGENGFYFNHEIDKASRGALLRKAMDDIRKSDSRIKGALISDCYEPKTEFDECFKKSGYHEITVESDMSMTLKPEWKKFEDYQAALASKYRLRVKKAFAAAKENAVEKRELNLEEIKHYEDRLFECYDKIMQRAEFKLAELDKSFFVLQKQLFPDNYRVFGYFKDGEMQSFISLYCFGKKMEVHYTGMEQETAKHLQLYPNMLYDMIRFGIENKVERLHFGRTAPEIKSTVGAVPSPMYGYLKHFNPIFNFLMVRTYTARLKPKEYVIREPFKAGE